MAFLRTGDTAAMDPRVLALADPDDDRMLNEAAGFLWRCSTLSAQYCTDYVLTAATAQLAAPTRWRVLVAALVRAGLMTKVPRKKDTWRVVDDPEFVHIRSRDEIEWERQRRKDASNPALTCPVRLRDGDGCRYCGKVVQWVGDRKSARSGTLDHRVPGQAGTVDTTVVSCRSCNSRRKNDPRADERVPLLPPPERPYYSEHTARYLTDRGFPVQPGTLVEARPDGQSDTAHPAPPSATPPPAGHRAPRTTQRDPAPGGTPRTPARSADPADPEDAARDGTGRAGTGRAGPGASVHPGAPADPSPPATGPGRRRARRGRRRSRGDA